jgi:Cu-Zn family superoxide dismutase
MVHRNWRAGQWSAIALAAVLVMATGCGKKPAEEAAPETAAPETPAPAPEPAPVQAVTQLQGGEGSTVSGAVTFTQTGGSVIVAAYVEGAPAGELGIHIHEGSECAGDFTSAGGHFNPAGHPHGGPGQAESHAGDLGNITVGEDGTGSLELTSTAITVDPGPNSVVGRTVILHEQADDLESQPTGAAGGRIACGVIQAAGADEGDGEEGDGEEGEGEEDEGGY